MARRVRISIGQATGVAQLLDDDAPRTAELVWRALPLEGQALPSTVGGAEIFLPLPQPLHAPFENQTIYPIPGDLTFYLQPTGAHQAAVSGPERHREVIGFVYGRDAQIYGPVVPLPLNVFATVTEGLHEVATEIVRMRREGFGVLRLSRME
ncbi:MAG: DUF3830 family protein [Armatimonadetes bacterium]|nr:DUF3830 family protein [Armatimonadota bacterium]